jgi:hypothetical protein
MLTAGRLVRGLTQRLSGILVREEVDMRTVYSFVVQESALRVRDEWASLHFYAEFRSCVGIRLLKSKL